MAKKFRKKREEGQPLWLLTYSDLVTQLLVFFVMLYAMGSMQSEKFDAVARSFSSTILFRLRRDNRDSKTHRAHSMQG